MSNEITGLSLCDVADAIRSRKLSATEVMEATLARIERLQPIVNAFILLEGNRAMEAAQVADELQANGEDLPSLHGVPMAHKDLLYRTGRVSSCGSKFAVRLRQM